MCRSLLCDLNFNGDNLMAKLHRKQGTEARGGSRHGLAPTSGSSHAPGAQSCVCTCSHHKNVHPLCHIFTPRASMDGSSWTVTVTGRRTSDWPIGALHWGSASLKLVRPLVDTPCVTVEVTCHVLSTETPSPCLEPVGLKSVPGREGSGAEEMILIHHMPRPPPGGGSSSERDQVSCPYLP